VIFCGRSGMAHDAADRIVREAAMRTDSELPVLRPCCVERFVISRNALKLLGMAGNTAQHETGFGTKPKLARNPYFSGVFFGALGEIRTPDPRNRNPMLYPAELRARFQISY
jgi:hypothetical protein